MSEKKGVKVSEIDAKIKQHEENLKKVTDELQQITQMQQERTTQKIALEGAIAGLKELASKPAK
tara:strand:- start:228 stop:419 length:192 start_codon:yes stop_codon:yes gene_type:complete